MFESTRVFREVHVFLKWIAGFGCALLCALPLNAGEVAQVRLSQTAIGTQAEITLSENADYAFIQLKDPSRLVVDFKDTTISRRIRIPAATGVVTAVRTGAPTPDIARIVFDLAENVTPLNPRLESRAGKRVLVFDLPGDDESSTTTAAVTPPPEAMPTVKPAIPVVGIATGEPAPKPSTAVPPTNTTPTLQAPVRTVADVAKRAAGRPLLIAIDAGHGGQDTGARGASGSMEKHITLAVAKKLAAQINATPGMRAYLTRDSDFFIPLVQRYQKARAKKADMFVSVHADAFTSPSASGSSVFVLSRRGSSSQAARWLADQENAADLVGGVRLKDKDNSLASVLLDLSQSATQRASEEIAGQVLRGLKDLGKTHKGEIERANFVVLRSPDVPSILVETAFISNPGEERRLLNPDYQEQLARAVLNGIHTYFKRQPPPGTQYASIYGDNRR